jgi:cleavage and polyadenylation specificity factor subunit 1
LLAFLETGDLFIYRAFEFADRAVEGPPLRFRRVQHGLITRPVAPPASALVVRRRPNGKEAPAKEKKLAWRGGPRLMPFENIGGRSGVLIGGPRPAWLLSERDHHRIHHLVMPSETGKQIELKSTSISCATPFHNVNCEHGFLYFNMSGVMHISLLPPATPIVATSLNKVVQDGQSVSKKAEDGEASKGEIEMQPVDCDSDLCTRRIPLQGGYVPRFIVRHEPTQTYAVVVSRQRETMSMEQTTERSLPIYIDQYEVLLYSSTSWEPIGRFDALEEDEAVLCISAVKLYGKIYLVLGTSNHEGEETASKGRVIMLDLHLAMGVNTEGKTQRMLKIKQSSKKENSGPVSAIADIDNLLLLCIGPKIMLYHWDNEKQQLTGRAFFDATFFVVQVRNSSYFCDTT